MQVAGALNLKGKTSFKSSIFFSAFYLTSRMLLYINSTAFINEMTGLHACRLFFFFFFWKDEKFVIYLYFRMKDYKKAG